MGAESATLSRAATKQTQPPAKQSVRPSADRQRPVPQRELVTPGGTAVPKSFAGIPPLAPGEDNWEILFSHRALRLPLQRKLAIGAVNDPLEAEADAVAERVMRGPIAPPAIQSSSPAVRRKCSCEGNGKSCEACQEEKKDRDENKLLRKAEGAVTPVEAPPIVREVLHSPGQPLDASTRGFMEALLGHDFGQVRIHAQGSVPVPARLAVGAPHDAFEQEAGRVAQRALSHSSAPAGGRPDFSGVRIHTDAKAAESAQAVNARAYTVGNHIVFGTGQPAAGTNAGQRLLAHELAHVMQQTRGRLRRAGAGTASPEPEQGEGVRTGSSSLTLQRDLAIEPPQPLAVGRVLTPAEMRTAIEFNQRVVAVIGEAGIRRLRDVLGISLEPAVIDEDFVRAVVGWQAVQGLLQDGKLGSATAHPLFREIGAEHVGRCQLASGPTYHALVDPAAVPVVGDTQVGDHRIEAEFADDPANGLFASCCEVRQFIQWDAVSAGDLPGGHPHAGFPAGTPAGTWIEDRDPADVIRFGHRSGPFAASLGPDNEYIDSTGRPNAAFGNIYHGEDRPFGPATGLTGQWRFMVRVFDVCTGKRVGSGDGATDYLTYTW